MLLHPTYFPSIIQYVAQVNSEKLLFEVEDNFQKQTYRNRCFVYGSNGRQMLNVPIVHKNKEQHTKTRDIQIDHSQPWEKIHVKTMDSAYSSSPFYEFYKDDIIEVISKGQKYLMDLNFDSINALNEALQIDIPNTKTKDFSLTVDAKEDFRYLVKAKNQKEYSFDKYTQVFDNKHGFIQNLSCLDLLFNQGPNAIDYLENHRNLLFQNKKN